jgi:transposase-like protein
MQYPDTYKQFYHMFDTEKKCAEYLVGIKYPDGFTCSKCKHKKYWVTKRSTLKCQNCRSDFSLTVGTLLNKRHLSLTTWFEAIWFVTSQKVGVSSLGLGRALGIKRPMTSWKLLKDLRCGMSQDGKDKLQNIVEIDEVFFGGIKKGPRGRGALGKEMVLVAVEDKEENGYGRIRMKIIPDARSETLLPVIKTLVEEKSSIRTDDHKSYLSLKDNNFTHLTTDRLVREAGQDSTPLVHRIASLVKRWLLGTHQGGVHLENLQDYLDEFVFRFNRRTSKSRGKLFDRLIQNMMRGGGK